MIDKIPDFKAKSETLENSVTELQRDKQTVLKLKNHIDVEAHLAATFHTAEKRFAKAGVEDGTTDEILLFDLRNVPVDQAGAKYFNGTPLTAQAEFIVIDPSCLDWQKGKGFKALRKGESFTYGRVPDKKDVNDPRSRFDASRLTSRAHFTLSLSEDGELSVKDTSTNGTTVSTGEKALDAVYGNAGLIEKTEVTTPRLIDPEATVEDEANIESSPSLPTVLSDERVAAIVERAKSRSEHYLTREMLTEPECKPVAGVKLDGKNFFVSTVHEIQGRKYMYSFVEDEESDDKRLKPRLFYKSKSDGGWRATPGVYGDGHISKGNATEYGGYVQMTKPNDVITQLLETVEEHVAPTTGGNFSQHIIERFNIPRLAKEGIGTFDGEAQPIYFARGRADYAGLNAYSPGDGFTERAGDARKHIREMQLPAGFEPDFNNRPVRSYDTENSFAGTVRQNVYRTEYGGKTLEWHVAVDSESNVWLDKVTTLNSSVTSYGTSSEVMLLGALSAKPFEYRHQVANMHNGIDYDQFDETYVDLRKHYWGKMPWVHRYKQANRL